MSVPEDVTITGDEWEMFPPHHDWRVNLLVASLRRDCEELQHCSRMLQANIETGLRVVRLMPAATREVDRVKDRVRLDEVKERVEYYTRRQGEHIAKILAALPGLNHTYLHHPPQEDDE